MIGFVGLTHLGIVYSLASASKGAFVLGYDADPNVVSRLQSGFLPIFEPNLDILLETSKTNIQWTNDLESLAACDLVVISQDVATDDHGNSDLSNLETSIRRVIPRLRDGATLVILSQVPPGFTKRLCLEFESTNIGKNFQIYYQVETLVFGNAVIRAMNPERIIIGSSNPKQSLPVAYRKWLESFACPLLIMKTESAELAKISINLCLIASITAANTIAEVCETIGADWSEIVPALRLDPRIGPQAYLLPGLGLSGGNLQRDLTTIKALAVENGTDSSFFDGCLANSQYRRDWVVRKLQDEVFPTDTHPTIALWGLAYKPGTQSMKNAPSINILDTYKDLSIRVYDPIVSLPEGHDSHVQTSVSPLECCTNADVLIVSTSWSEFGSIPGTKIESLMKGKVVIDPDGCLDLSRTNLQQHTMGRRLLNKGFVA